MIGISTYAFFWQLHSSAARPISWRGLLDKTKAFGGELFQFCDYPLCHQATTSQMREIARYAENQGIALELGTRGLDEAHMRHYLSLAQAVGITLVRGMIQATELSEAARLIGAFLPDYERAGVKIGLETYEQVPVAELVNLVDRIDSEYLGICLDPANPVAALEKPSDTIQACADRVNNLHVKDFAFTRQDGWVGFTYAGARLGEGLLDYHAMIDLVRPQERGINQVIEHWLVWQGDSQTTCRIEDEWTQHSLDYLKGNNE